MSQANRISTLIAATHPHLAPAIGEFQEQALNKIADYIELIQKSPFEHAPEDQQIQLARALYVAYARGLKEGHRAAKNGRK